MVVLIFFCATTEVATCVASPTLCSLIRINSQSILCGNPTLGDANNWNAVTSLRCMKMRGLDIWVLCSKSIRMIDSIGSLTTSTLILTPLGQRINTSLSLLPSGFALFLYNHIEGVSLIFMTFNQYCVKMT
jgi:hypothetical protein